MKAKWITYLPHRSPTMWKAVPGDVPMQPNYLRFKPIQIIGGKRWSLALLVQMSEEHRE